MIDGNIKKSLHLRRMQIDRHHAIGPGALDKIGHQLGGDRRAAGMLLVLPGISEIRNHRRHPLALARRSVSIQMNSSIRCALIG